MSSKKLYVVRSFIEASSLKEALRLSISHPPDEAYLADSQQQKDFFSNTSTESQIKGFKTT